MAQETGDLTTATYCCHCLITHRLASGDPLGDVQQEAEHLLDLARKARSDVVVDYITTQLGLIRTLRGMTSAFGSFNDAGFDEHRFEQHLQTESALGTATCWYWIRKLQAHWHAAAYASAVAAAEKARPLLAATLSFFETAEYHLYGALARAACWDGASAEERLVHFEMLTAHQTQIATWAQNCPENFGSWEVLVGAEIARIEARELDAERLYESAIQLARTQGFVQNEALANEVAARFYAAREFHTIADAYLRNARQCYLRWGAEGKVRQLEELHPQLRELPGSPDPAGTIDAPIEQLDLTAAIRASQVVLGEIVLENVIEKLMVLALEQAGAERGLLILSRGDELRIEAEATTVASRVTVHRCDDHPTTTDLPESVLRYVARTRQSVIVDDATAEGPFVADPYMRQRRARSILCVPLVKQSALVGVLYLENNLAPRVFTAARVELLMLLSSQAAISLENARLYSELREAEQKLRRHEEDLQRTIDRIPAMIWTAQTDGVVDFVNQRWIEFGAKRWSGDKQDGRWLFSVHSDDVPRIKEKWTEAIASGEPYELEGRVRRGDGTYRWLIMRAFPARDEQGAIVRWYGTSVDIEDRKRAEEKVSQQERELRTIVDFLPQLVGVANPDGSMVYANRACREFTGRSLEETVGRRVWPEIVHPDDLPGMQASMQRLAEGIGCEIEVRLRRSDGQYR